MLKTEHMMRRMPQIPQSIEHNGQIRSLERFIPLFPITDTWIREQFALRVRLGTGAEDMNRVYPALRHIPQMRISPDALPRISTDPVEPDEDYYKKVLQKRYPSLPDRFDSVAQALTLLLSPAFRAGPLENILDTHMTQLASNIQYAWKERLLPIEFIVPTLPFKDQCPVTTQASIHHIGLGEEVMLARWIQLARSLEYVGGQGSAVVRIISDGTVYADLFAGNKKGEAAQYQQHCIDYLQATNGDKNITVTDMETIVSLDERFPTVRDEIAQRLHTLYETAEDTNFIYEATALIRGLLFNMQLTAPYNHYDSFVEIANLSLPDLAHIAPEVYRFIYSASFGYASFLLTMQYLNILQRAFPERSQLRATVHPKTEQLGLRTGSSSVAPYNGVCVLDIQSYRQTDDVMRSTKNMRFFQALEYPDLTAVHVDDNPDAFFYITEYPHHHMVISNTQNEEYNDKNLPS